MTSAGSAYTTDLIYPSAFVFGQTPLFMQWAAAAQSAPRLLSAPFTYCDLGCGDGITLNVLAAQYPAASFIGIDINPEHLGLARKLAARAGLANVSFRQANFADLATAGLPPLDFIAAHGVYSWIDERARDDLHAFVSHQLQPGGLFCVQYATLPGSTVHDPLYTYLKWFAERVPGESVQRFTAGYEVLQKLRPHSTFFRALPHAGELLDSFSRHPLGLLAHEILNRNQHSLYFHEVHDAMAALGLSYMGSGDLKLNHPELLMSRSDYAIFEDVTRNGGSRLRLAAQDLILNTSTRTDVFRRPDAAVDAAPGRAGLRGVESLYLRRIGGADSLEARRRASAAAAVDLAAPVHSAVMEAVGGASTTVAEALNAPAVRAFDRAVAETALAQLVMMRFLNVLIAPARELAYRPDRRYRFASPINSILLDETIQVPEAVAFASPVLGSALMIPPDARLRLAAWLGRDLDRVWQIFGQVNRRLLDSRGNALTSFERFRAETEAALPQFVANLVPDLLRFGLLEEAA